MQENRIRRRNFAALTLEGAFFVIGTAFIDVNAVIPVFIFTYMHSLKLAGLAATINLAASIVAQTLIGPYVRSIRRMPFYITLLMFIFRPLTLLMIPVLFSGLSDAWNVAVFLFLYSLLFFGDGLVVVAWTDLLGRTILPENRGKVFGYQQLLGGIGALAAGFLIKYLLENQTLTNDQRYAIIFSGAAVSLLVSAVAMSFSRDLPRIPATRPARNWHYYAQFPACLRRHPEFRRVAVIRILSGIAAMIAPLMILYGQGIFGLDAAQISTLVYIQIIGGLVGGLFWSQISSRLGNKAVIRAAQVTGLAIPAYALVCLLFRQTDQAWYLLWPLILVNGMYMGSWVGFLNYTIDIVEEEERTVYLLLSNLITFPLSILSFLAGIFADWIGFLPLFGVSGLAALAGIFLSRRLQSPCDLPPETAGVRPGCPADPASVHPPRHGSDPD